MSTFDKHVVYFCLPQPYHGIKSMLNSSLVFYGSWTWHAFVSATLLICWNWKIPQKPLVYKLSCDCFYHCIDAESFMSTSRCISELRNLHGSNRCRQRSAPTFHLAERCYHPRAHVTLQTAHVARKWQKTTPSHILPPTNTAGSVQEHTFCFHLIQPTATLRGCVVFFLSLYQLVHTVSSALMRGLL